MSSTEVTTNLDKTSIRIFVNMFHNNYYYEYN